MRVNVRLIALGLVFLFVRSVCGGPGDKRLDIYWVDVEGGAATLIVTPAGESILVDTGLPGERDPGRIHKVATEVAGLERIDHLIVTHFDLDHYGGAADLARLLPVKRFLDPGIPPKEGRFARRIAPYEEAAAGKRKVLRAGDRIDLEQAPGTAKLSLVCLGAQQKFVEPRDADRKRNRHCDDHVAKQKDLSQNANSTVLLLTLGDFQFLDAADLTWNLEQELVCPSNRVGKVDVFQANHHGLDQSNNPVLVRSVEPRVAVINNGPRKGCEPDTFKTLKTTPSVEAIYQVHRNVRVGPEGNTQPEKIANAEEKCSAAWIRLSVEPSGASYVVSVPATGHEETYRTR